MPQYKMDCGTIEKFKSAVDKRTIRFPDKKNYKIKRPGLIIET